VYRNKAIYEFFKGCPDKPRYKYKKAAEYFLQVTTGGPIKEVKSYEPRSREQVARAILMI